MKSPLPTHKAKEAALLLQEALDIHTALDYEGDKLISTDYLFGPARGQMFGVLVCEDQGGSEVVLKAFSGQYDSEWLIPGWVGPVADPLAFTQIVTANDERLHELTATIEGGACSDTATLIQERKSLSQSVLRELYALYEFTCIGGQTKTFADIFGSRLPPTGTGECCAPKLLHWAFSHGLKPISMAEFYYGRPNRSGSREHKAFYGPCDDKCQPLLRHMLALDIVYCDETLLVVNKEGGLLSVPGRGADKQDSVESRVRRLFPSAPKQCAVHRLDMDTSGLLVIALTKESHRALSIQFMHQEVEKEYHALLEGVVKAKEGEICLPFRLDVERRPYQIYDEQQGKWGTTRWKKVRVESSPAGLITRVHFTPLTGRTHQLRVHSSHPKGIGHPIVGDRLYGTGKEGERLCLHASFLSFMHPHTGERLTFTSPEPF
ncbi:MAG: RluA family pseudouridine synthase [Sphaerochaeta sp.]|nr:RluA family pseudouridine synthase [Sphaerochaeta sp.]